MDLITLPLSRKAGLYNVCERKQSLSQGGTCVVQGEWEEGGKTRRRGARARARGGKGGGGETRQQG